MTDSKKYKGSGKKVSRTKIFGIPATLYSVKYDKVVTVSNDEILKEVQTFHEDGSVTVSGEVVRSDD